MEVQIQILKSDHLEMQLWLPQNNDEHDLNIG